MVWSITKQVLRTCGICTLSFDRAPTQTGFSLPKMTHKSHFHDFQAASKCFVGSDGTNFWADQGRHKWCVFSAVLKTDFDFRRTCMGAKQRALPFVSIMIKRYITNLDEGRSRPNSWNMSDCNCWHHKSKLDEIGEHVYQTRMHEHGHLLLIWSRTASI